MAEVQPESRAAERRHARMALYPVGRFLLSLVFIASGFGKLTNMQGNLIYLETYGLPPDSLLLTGAAVVELVGAFCLLAGWGVWLAASALILYLLPVTFIFHTDFSDQNQVFHFLKNCAIIGGLLEAIVLDRSARAGFSGIRKRSYQPRGGAPREEKVEPPRSA